MCSITNFLFKNSSIIIQAFFIIVGWIIVHKLTTKRDVEKSRRDIISTSIDKLCELVNLITDDSNNYHLSKRNKSLENKIKRELTDLSIRASSLKDLINDKDCEPIWINIRKYRQSITGNHFEDEHIKVLIDSSEQFERIAEYDISLKRTLYELKHAQFKLT